MCPTTVLEKPTINTSIQANQTKKILVVEDSPKYSLFLKTVFEDHGFQVSAALSAEEALQFVSNETPDLITLDLLMPGKTGIKLYRELRKQSNLANTRIVILTGVDTDSDGLCSFDEFFQRVSRGGHVPKPDAYLTKPIEAEELISSVQQAMNS